MDDSEATQSDPSSKQIKTRKIMDYVLIPGFSQKQPASSTQSDANGFAFVLTDQECKKLEKPVTMSPSFNANLYMRFTFNIDMTKVPGRVRQSANFTGKYVFSSLFYIQAKLKTP
ncbi:hypothetical protein J3R83DRAFT_9048 [Lanmaoa asiatica]|nr:hypothetical protein J3R83DRAFT_9048 [Lanmaoa asiatica]